MAISFKILAATDGVVAGRVEVVQVLRFVAAVSVVGAHLPGIERGHWGVDLFFVISGFVMCLSTTRSSDKFLLKRIIRVVPLYWLLTFAVFGIAIVAPTLLNNTEPNPLYLLKSLFFIPFDRSGTGHFPILLVGWTLDFEMMFYAIFAVALYFVPRRKVAVTALLIFALYVLTGWFAQGFPFVVYADPIIFEFSLGMLAYTLLARPDGWLIDAALVVVTIGLGMLLVREGLENRLLLYGFACAAVFFGAVVFLGHMRMPALLLLFGNASYSLYLGQPFVIEGATKAGLFGGGGVSLGLAGVAVIAACLALSAFLWLIVERPMSEYLRGKLLGSSRRRDQPRTARASVRPA